MDLIRPLSSQRLGGTEKSDSEFVPGLCSLCCLLFNCMDAAESPPDRESALDLRVTWTLRWLEQFQSETMLP